MFQNVSPASNARGSDEVSTLFYCGVLRGKSVGGELQMHIFTYTYECVCVVVCPVGSVMSALCCV